MKDYDDTLIDSHIVQIYPNNVVLMTESFNGLRFVVSSRDFLFLAHNRLDSAAGSIELAVVSTEDPRAPPSGKHVRGRIIVWMFAAR